MARKPAVPAAPRRSVRQWKRAGLKDELLLAIPPTTTVLLALGLSTVLTRQRILFASLAASAFLIYAEPRHRMNTNRVMVTAQLIGSLFGIAAATIFGSGYLAAGLAMALTILAMVTWDIVHPPPISTTIGFGFGAAGTKVFILFVLALSMVATLIVLQRITLWVVGRAERRQPLPPP